jgi:hypothetical protein
MLHARAPIASPFTLPLTDAVATHALPQLRLLAAPAHALILIDTYRSQALGLAECQSGAESFLRILTLERHRVTLAYSTPLTSCRHDLSLALDGLHFDPASTTIHLHWLTAPAAPEHRQSIHLDRTGQIAP